MDSYVTYLQITSAKSSKVSLLQLPPSPHVSTFSLYRCCLLQMQVWRDLSFYIGGSLPPPCRAVGLPAAPPPGGRGLYAIELKF